MSRYHSYLHSATSLVNLYKGEEPFASFSKKFFAQHTKYGSRDRKQISHLCYGYFRLGKALRSLPVEQRIIAGLFLAATAPGDMLAILHPEWNEKASLPLAEKCEWLGRLYNEEMPAAVFPWRQELGESIDAYLFSLSFFIQPDMFLRLRPGHGQQVARRLQEAGLPFQQISTTCIALPNGSRIENIIAADREAVVQDRSSQQVIAPAAGTRPTTVWDCCAASGGKSVLLYDSFPGIDLTVSDIRESILANLRKRFREAGIRHYQSRVLDLSNEQFPGNTSFSMILADVPCTGSGTWARTPEQLYYFDEHRIGTYASLQRKIITNALAALQPGGYFLYITCSVFRQENEDNVRFMEEQLGLRLLHSEVIKGYMHKADTMFTALLQLPEA